jgi:hypothetical protein
VRNKRGRAAAFANQYGLIAIELVFRHQVVDDRNDLVSRGIKDGARGVLN